MPGYKYNKKYAEAYEAKQDRVVVRVPKGQKDAIKEYAASRGESVNAVICRLINAELNATKADPR